MNTNNTKFPISNMPHQNKFGMHLPPVYRVVKPSEVPVEKAIEEGEPELSDIYPLQYTSSMFSHEDISNNNQTAIPSTFVLSDYLRKP